MPRSIATLSSPVDEHLIQPFQLNVPQSAIDDLIVSCYTSEDFRNAVIAFLDKRPPSFTGR